MISIKPGSTDEHDVILREIVSHLSSLGLEVQCNVEVPQDANHGSILIEMQDQGFPILVKVSYP